MMKEVPLEMLPNVNIRVPSHDKNLPITYKHMLKKNIKNIYKPSSMVYIQDSVIHFQDVQEQELEANARICLDTSD